MIKLSSILKEWFIELDENSDLLEEKYYELNELKIDALNTYSYEEASYLESLGYSKAWQFDDRCGNKIVVVYLESMYEFKSGYKIDGVDTLIFDPKKLPQNHKEFGDLRDKIKHCPDDKKVNTVYKVLIEEVIPKYTLSKKPNKLFFNPVSESRKRLVDIILNNVVKIYPQLIKKDDYLIYK